MGCELKRVLRGLAICCAAIAGTGCAADDPTPTDSMAQPADDGVDAVANDTGGGDGPEVDGGGPCTVDWALPAVQGDNAACTAQATDYVPGSTDDPYDTCISDDDAYHPFDPSIGSVGRVAGFEKIAALLLKSEVPSAQDFTAARVIYAEAEGLGSRLERREDEHYPKAEQKCADMTAEEIAQNPDRCVGQAQLQPLLNQAFADGSKGKDPLLNAARVEAGLLWFLYVSVYKESTTCSDTQKDCDSSYAYYTGGEARSGGLGLARYVRSVSQQAHDRIWDGILAVRCWRDLDSGSPATDLTTRDQALAQMDRALLRGMALIVNSRVAAYEAAPCAAAQQALWAAVQLLGGVLDREATVRDAAKARTLREELAKAGAEANLDAITGALDDVFDCP